MQFLGSDERKAVGEIETHLITENRYSACSCAVVFYCAVVENMTQKILILFHFVDFEEVATFVPDELPFAAPPSPTVCIIGMSRRKRPVL